MTRHATSFRQGIEILAGGGHPQFYGEELQNPTTRGFHSSITSIAQPIPPKIPAVIPDMRQNPTLVRLDSSLRISHPPPNPTHLSGEATDQHIKQTTGKMLSGAAMNGRKRTPTKPVLHPRVQKLRLLPVKSRKSVKRWPVGKPSPLKKLFIQ